MLAKTVCIILERHGWDVRSYTEHSAKSFKPITDKNQKTVLIKAARFSEGIPCRNSAYIELCVREEHAFSDTEPFSFDFTSISYILVKKSENILPPWEPHNPSRTISQSLTWERKPAATEDDIERLLTEIGAVISMRETPLAEP